MREVLPELMDWWHAGDTVGVGTVVATFQSAPRPAGASMLVGPDGTAVGSVSGGCVEGAVYDLAQTVNDSGESTLQRYGVSDDDAFTAGLTCGGIIDVYVEKISQETFPELGAIAADVDAGRPVAVAVVVEHPDRARVGRRLVVRPDQDPVGSLGSARADDAVGDDALGLLAAGSHATLSYGREGERRGEGMRVFVWALAPQPRLLVFGAIDFAAAVARVGRFLGYHVTVCDARPVFATEQPLPTTPTKSSSTGHIATCLPRPTPGGSTPGPPSRSSPTTPSSTYHCSRSPSGYPRSPMSARWGHDARIWIAWTTSATSASPRTSSADWRARSGSTSERGLQRRQRSASLPRSSRGGGVAPATPSPRRPETSTDDAWQVVQEVNTHIFPATSSASTEKKLMFLSVD